MRIVYDYSVKSDPKSPSLNDCLEVGPPLQPMIFATERRPFRIRTTFSGIMFLQVRTPVIKAVEVLDQTS